MIDLPARLRDARPVTHDMNHTMQGDLMDEAADEIEGLRSHLRDMARYGQWQIDSGHPHHPTLPSAVAAAREAAGPMQNAQAKEPKE